MAEPAAEPSGGTPAAQPSTPTTNAQGGGNGSTSRAGHLRFTSDGHTLTEEDMDKIFAAACALHQLNPAKTDSVTIPLADFYKIMRQLKIKITDEMQMALAWGCVGFASWTQSPDHPGVTNPKWDHSQPRWDPPPAFIPENFGNSGNTKHTVAFRSDGDAQAFAEKQRKEGKKALVFGKQGAWKDGKEPDVTSGAEYGRIPNDSVESVHGHENYITEIGGYVIWMSNWRMRRDAGADAGTPREFEPNPDNPEAARLNRNRR